LYEALADLVLGSVHNLVAPPGIDVGALQRTLRGWPLFTADAAHITSLPPGPLLFIGSDSGRLSRHLLTARSRLEPRVLLLPRHAADPVMPSAALVDRYAGRQIPIEDLNALLQQ
jgi:hypothetical protein